MDNEPNKTEEKIVEDKVLADIESGKLKMRPRWQFILQTTLLAIGAILILFAVLYLVSFIFFILHENGAWFVPAFGLPGWFALFRRLPWALIGLAVVFIAILEFLVRRYSFAYHRPLLASALTIIGIVLVGGALISATRFHNDLFAAARHNGLPIVGGMYRGYGMPRFNDIHPGEVIETATGTFVLQDDDGDTSTVIITPQTMLPEGDGFEASETVIVFGPAGPDRIIQAFGIQRIDE